MEKYCSKCKATKDTTEFVRLRSGLDGLAFWCKACRKAVAVARQDRYRSIPLEDKPVPVEKRCSHCRATKPIDEFVLTCISKDGHAARCKTCTREASANHYANHPDRYAGKSSAWYKRNREKACTQDRKRKAMRRKLYPEAEREFKQKNKARIEANRKRRLKDPVRLERHRDLVRAAASNRRARVKSQGGSFTAEEFSALCKRYGNRCLRCGEGGKLQADHVFPLKLGGSGYVTNIQPLCKSCNSWKHDRFFDYRPETMDMDDIGLEAAA